MTAHLPFIWKRLKAALLGLFIAVAPGAALYIPFDALAQSWPNRVVKIVVLGNPGNAPDIVARILAEHLAAAWGQGVIIDNRPAGPGGNLAAQYVAQSAPDGYTLKLAISPQLVMNPYLFKTLGYDAERDFAPIVRIGAAPMMLAVNPALPVHNLSDLVAFSKSRPSKVFYATAGSRLLPHFVGEAFNQMSGAGLTQVNYKGGSMAAGKDTAAGETQVYIDAIAAMTPWVNGGRLRPIAVFGPNRVAGFEQVPTAKESGFDLSILGWMSLVAPAGTPPEVIGRVNKDVNAALARPEVAAKLRGFALADLGGSTRDFEITLAQDRKFWEAYVRTHGVEKE
jgi:tripartite-type tricarboxylate transporter receptor subunit TctC